MAVKWAIDGSFLDAGQRVTDTADTVLGKLAFDVKARAQEDVPRDTGALGASLYVVSQKTDGYGDMAGEVEAANPKLKDELMPDDVTTEAILTWFVVVGVKYGWWVHEGHETSKGNSVGPRPFLEQAMEEVGAQAETVLAAALGGLK